MKKITFTDKEMEAVRAAFANPLLDPDVTKGLCSLYDKMQKVEAKEEIPRGLPWIQAERAIRDVIGSRLVLPPRPGPEWYVKMARRLKETGVTEDDIRAATRIAQRQRRGLISAEWIVWNITTLLAEVKPEKKEGEPNEPRKWGLREEE